MSNISIPKSLDKKYALLWLGSNNGEIAKTLPIPRWLKPFNERDKRIHQTAVWQVMDMLADDGVIKQETIRDLHDKENSWLPGTSQISVGRVPIHAWLIVGIAFGSGGQLLVIGIIGLVRHFL